MCPMLVGTELSCLDSALFYFGLQPDVSDSNRKQNQILEDPFRKCELKRFLEPVSSLRVAEEDLSLSACER